MRILRTPLHVELSREEGYASLYMYTAKPPDFDDWQNFVGLTWTRDTSKLNVGSRKLFGNLYWDA